MQQIPLRLNILTVIVKWSPWHSCQDGFPLSLIDLIIYLWCDEKSFPFGKFQFNMSGKFELMLLACWTLCWSRSSGASSKTIFKTKAFIFHWIISMFECQCYEKWTCSTGISVASTFFLLLLNACVDGERKKNLWEKSAVLYITNLYITVLWIDLPMIMNSADVCFHYFLFLRASTSRAVLETLLLCLWSAESIDNIKIVINEFFVWFIIPKLHKRKTRMNFVITHQKNRCQCHNRKLMLFWIIEKWNRNSFCS